MRKWPILGFGGCANNCIGIKTHSTVLPLRQMPLWTRSGNADWPKCKRKLTL